MWSSYRTTLSIVEAEIRLINVGYSMIPVADFKTTLLIPEIIFLVCKINCFRVEKIYFYSVAEI